MQPRLTLRTLLAHRDEVLSAEQAVILTGKIARSPRARLLQKRMDRLAAAVRPIPAVSPLDPNDLAEYIDNVLPAAKVAEFEHQILAADRALRETVQLHRLLARVLRSASPAIAVPPPAIIPPMTSDRRNWRSAPAALALMLLSGGAWFAGERFAGSLDVELAPAAEEVATSELAIEAPAMTVPERASTLARLPAPLPMNIARKIEDAPATVPLHPEDEGSVESALEPVVALLRERDAAELKTDPLPYQPWIVDRAPGALAFRIGASGLEILQPGDTLVAGDVLIHPAGFDGCVNITGAIRLYLAPTEPARLSKSGVDDAIEVWSGRWMVRSDEAIAANTAITFRVMPEDITVIARPNGTEWSIEGSLSASEVAGEGRRLELRSVIGSFEVRTGKESSRLPERDRMSCRLGAAAPEVDRLTTPTRDPSTAGAPVSDKTASAAAKLAARLAVSKEGLLVQRLQWSIDDREAEVRKLALESLAAIGTPSPVVAGLENPRYRDVRLTAATILRRQLAARGESASAVRTALRSAYAADEAIIVERLLAGLSLDELQEVRVQSRVIELLTSHRLAIRELAIGQLRAATGHDFGFAPAAEERLRAIAITRWRHWSAAQNKITKNKTTATTRVASRAGKTKQR